MLTPSPCIEALRRGDAAAFETMVRRHGARMLAVARRFVRNEEDAREVVQEACLQAFRALADFRADATLSTWLPIAPSSSCATSRSARPRRLLGPSAFPRTR